MTEVVATVEWIALGVTLFLIGLGAGYAYGHDRALGHLAKGVTRE